MHLLNTDKCMQHMSAYSKQQGHTRTGLNTNTQMNARKRRLLHAFQIFDHGHKHRLLSSEGYKLRGLYFKPEF
jgi:hypothetical protein